MAQLLVKAEDSPTLKDNPKTAWRKGDVIAVMSDNHTWGKEEGPPKFAIIHIPGISIEECQHLLEPEEGLSIEENLSIKQNAMIQRRKIQFDLDKLTENEKNDISDNIKKGKIKIEDRNLKHFEKDVTLIKNI